jgi:hypothetical protein
VGLKPRRFTTRRPASASSGPGNLHEDGSFTVQFGDCDGKTPNCLPITPGWNYMVRLYRPQKEILDGSSKFPAGIVVK